MWLQCEMLGRMHWALADRLLNIIGLFPRIRSETE